MKRLLILLGVDRTIAYTLAGRGWGVFSGIVTLFLIVRFLTPDEQGYYYTFASVLAMQVIFELGMSYVVMQFASHEMAQLEWSATGIIQGDARAKGRLRSLVLLVLKWYGMIAGFVIVAILPAGWIFFSINNPHSAVAWQMPWVWLVIAASVNIFLMPLLALLEGCGRVAEVARLRMAQNIVGSLAAWMVLAAGGGLLAASALSSGLALTAAIWLWKTKKLFFRDLLKNDGDCNTSINWRTEILPFQLKIALSSLCGFLIFQFFTPVIFAYRGVVEAGQIGMSINIANAVASIAMAWMNAKAPGFGTLIAKSDYTVLNRIFSLTLWRSLSVMIGIGVILCVVNYILHLRNFPVAIRLLDPLAFTLLMLATTFNYVSYAQAAYLRAHKEDPFLILSVVCAVLICVLTLVLGKQYGASGAMFGFFAVSGGVGLGWGSLIFNKKRREWQVLKYQGTMR